MDSTSKVGRHEIFVMPDGTPIKVSASRYFSAHHMMIWAARQALPSAATPQNALVVIAMCIMAGEALANSVGTRIYDKWEDIDSLSPWGKYRVICRELKIPCDKGEGLWQRLHQLLAMRNAIVHAKPERVEASSITTVGDYNAAWWAMHPFPSSKLELNLTADKAKQAVDTIELVLKAITAKLVGLDKDFIDGDIAQHEVELHDSPQENQPHRAHNNPLTPKPQSEQD